MMRERMSPVERRKQLLEVAFKCFSEQGYVGTTVTDIVKQAGVAKGTFFYYFPTKEDVFIALTKNEMANLIQRLRAMRDNRSALERLQLTLEIIQEPNRLEPIIDKMYDSGEVRLIDVLWQVVQRSFDEEIRDIIIQGVKEGVMHVADLDIAIEYYWAIVDRMLGLDEYDSDSSKSRMKAGIGIIEHILGIAPDTLV